MENNDIPIKGTVFTVEIRDWSHRLKAIKSILLGRKMQFQIPQQESKESGEIKQDS
jgi:hypothetical protein